MDYLCLIYMKRVLFYFDPQVRLVAVLPHGAPTEIEIGAVIRVHQVVHQHAQHLLYQLYLQVVVPALHHHHHQRVSMVTMVTLGKLIGVDKVLIVSW